MSAETPVAQQPHSYATVTEKLGSIALRGIGGHWLKVIGAAAVVLLVFGVAVGVLLVRGVGIWGVNIPAAWGFAIINFMWWIGIAHAGSLISASLLLTDQPWRGAISRFAEAMAIFALACAALFPLLHLGRPFVFYWLMPYPNAMGLWPQFRSPLVWDVFSIIAYGTVVVLFWYVGMLPDLATLRDRADSKFVRRFYGVLALGWRGAASHWQLQQNVYRILAGLAVGLVFSLHSLVSLAVTIVPGWHSAIYPPYFVAGALLSGLAVLLLLAVIIRAAFGLGDFITERHFDGIAKVLLASSCFVGYVYLSDIVLGLRDVQPNERFVFLNRMTGEFSEYFWAMVICNVLAPQILWLRSMRRSARALLILGIIVTIGTWLDRVIILLTPLERDFLPSAWKLFQPQFWDWATQVGVIGLFAVGFLLFVRVLPISSISEVKRYLPSKGAADPATETVHAGTRPENSYGVLAAFDAPQALVDATTEAHIRGHRAIETFTPFNVRDVHAFIRSGTFIPALIAFGAGAGGAVTVYAMQYYASVISYPLNVGGRPLHSWPAFIPAAIESAFLGAGVAAFAALLIMARLPRLDHPLFAATGFERATSDRFFLLIESSDERYDAEAIRGWLERHRPLSIEEVAA